MKEGCLCVLFLVLSVYAHMPSSFTRDVFLKTWAVNEKVSNIIVSPYSLVAPLGTLALASEGKSQKQILNAFRVKTIFQVSGIHTVCKQLISAVNNVVIKTSNMLYVPNFEELLPEFNAAAHQIYDVDVRSVNFSNPEKTAEQLNTWVEKETENRIKTLIDPSSLESTTGAMLINTIYFDGRWMKRFDSSVKSKFYADNQSTMMVPTMKVETILEYGYIKILQAEVVKIPYKDEKCFFVVVLPNNTTKVDNLKIKLKKKNAVNNALNTLLKTHIELYMPLFEFETQTDLKTVLKKLHVKDIFSKKAKLTAITKSDSKLFIQSAIQKAYIKVNEKGTQAGAANAFSFSYLSASFIPGKKIAIDRPFYFEIRCSTVTLFNGIVRKP